jgi:type I restriction enzyme, S subunit
MTSVYLDEVCVSIDYGVTASATLFDVGPKFLRITDIQDGEVDWEAVPYCDAEPKKLVSSRLQPGDIVFARTGATTGKSFLIRKCPENAVFASYLIRVRPGPQVDPAFLAHFFDSPEYWGQIALKASGAAQPGVNASKLKELKIPLPPLEEQKRIAGILDQADALRRLRTRALDKLNTLGQVIFYEKFGDPLVDHASDPDWVTETLDTNIHFIDYRGKTPPKAPNGVRLVTAKNVRMGYINPEPREYIEADAFDEWMSRGFPKKGDVLFTTEAPLGNVAILDTEEKLVVGQRLITLQPKKDRITSEYLSFFLRSPTFHRRMMENSSGSTVTGIKSKLLKKIMICYPSVAAQQKFSEAIEAATMLKAHCEVGSVDTEALFASLQHRAFRGEL